nr:reverse transcriptase domain-containing protein [Tanacetum cinerariifolium]
MQHIWVFRELCLAVKPSNVDSLEIASVVASAVTSVMTVMFKQHQVTPAPASVKAVKESCVTCGGAHSYRQRLATNGDTFSGYQDNSQEYVSAAACMQTRSSSKFIGEPSTNPISTNPKRHNQRRSKPRVKPFSLEETPVVTMADQRTMAELLRVPTEGYAEATVVPSIPVERFELKHSLINLVTSKQFFDFEKEDPHARIRYFNKITSTLKYKDVPETSIKLMLFPFSIDGLARIWLDKEPSRSILTWDDFVSKFINHFFPP